MPINTNELPPELIRASPANNNRENIKAGPLHPTIDIYLAGELGEQVYKTKLPSGKEVTVNKVFDNRIMGIEGLLLAEEEARSQKEEAAATSLEEKQAIAHKALERTAEEIKFIKKISTFLRGKSDHIVFINPESITDMVDPSIPRDAVHLLTTRDIIPELTQKFHDAGFTEPRRQMNNPGIIFEKGNATFVILFAPEKGDTRLQENESKPEALNPQKDLPIAA